MLNTKIKRTLTIQESALLARFDRMHELLWVYGTDILRSLRSGETASELAKRFNIDDDAFRMVVQVARELKMSVHGQVARRQKLNAWKSISEETARAFSLSA